MNLIYIAGEVRSGTTIVDYVLANHYDILSVGEFANLDNYIYRKGVGSSSDWTCSCGQHLDRCEFWKPVLEFFLDHAENKEIQTKSNVRFSDNDNNRVCTQCWEILEHISHKRAEQFIVDSSKTAIQLNFIEKTKKDNKLFVIFIIRDSRAVSYSKYLWDKRFNRERPLSLIAHMFIWLRNNIRLASVISKKSIDGHIILDYKGLALDPKKAFDGISNLLKIEQFDDDLLYLTNQDRHNIAGTPNRKRFDRTKIRYDDRWEYEFSARNHFIANFIGVVLNKILQIYIQFKLHKKISI